MVALPQPFNGVVAYEGCGVPSLSTRMDGTCMKAPSEAWLPSLSRLTVDRMPPSFDTEHRVPLG